jgi:hypothetical protein
MNVPANTQLSNPFAGGQKIDFNINDSLIKFYLRKQESVLKIKKFVSTWYKYTRLFKIYSGSDEINPGFGINVNYHEFYNINNTDNSITGFDIVGTVVQCNCAGIDWCHVRNTTGLGVSNIRCNCAGW